MNIYLLRHAIAEERDAKKYPDDDRPLTADGVKKMQEAALGITEVLAKVDAILTSPLKRARHTADIVAKALKAEKLIEVTNILLPGCWAESAISHLAARKNDDQVMMVGHEPDLGLLASALMGVSHGVIEFRKGSICSIRVEGKPGQVRGMLEWHLMPRQLRMLAS